jgi:hypothetical protein
LRDALKNVSGLTIAAGGIPFDYLARFSPTRYFSTAPKKPSILAILSLNAWKCSRCFFDYWPRLDRRRHQSIAKKTGHGKTFATADFTTAITISSTTLMRIN